MPDPSFIQTQQGSSIYLWNGQLLDATDPALFTQVPPQILQHNTLGRGTVVMFAHGDLELVRRHYQRGGLVRHISRDIYLGSTVANTRMWREFHLLQELWQLALPVPQPVAARCEKIAPFLYRGDLITLRIPASYTLAETLRKQSLSDDAWRELGATLARFHQHGVYHADLNANNILVNEAGRFYLIDFDRGEKRNPDSAWQQNNLDRLLRSLDKLQRLHESFHFSATNWAALQSGYRNQPSLDGEKTQSKTGWPGQ